MAGLEIINWEKTSYAERKTLHTHTLTLKRRLNIDWTETYRLAFGARDNVGVGYEDNFRKGRISPQKAWKIFNWLFENDPVLASNVENDILAARSELSSTHALSWDEVLSKGEFSGIEVLKPGASLGMAQFARRQSAQGLKLELLEEFYFEITAPFDGVLIAFQSYRDIWHPQLIADGASAIEISLGKNIIPAGEDNQPDPLWEETDTGKHGFAFLLTQDHTMMELVQPPTSPQQGIPAKLRDEFARRATQTPDIVWKLFRINLMFV